MSRTGSEAPRDPVTAVVEAISRWRRNASPLVVAIDGHGAAGKSTLAERVAARLASGVAVVHVDDFWRSSSTDAVQRRTLADYYDWERVRAEALEPLRAGRTASFVAVDPDTDARRARSIDPAPVILLEGVSASCPDLADLVARSVLVEAPEPVRTARLRSRVPADEWDELWLDAERSYLATRPRGSFDLIVSGTDPG